MIADRMVLSKTTIPHATTDAEVDMTNVVRYREAKKDEFARREGIPLSYVAFVIKAAVDAKLGDEVVLLGAQGPDQSVRIGADELAAWSDTISWEIFCGISKRVPRVYVGERW